MVLSWKVVGKLRYNNFCAQYFAPISAENIENFLFFVKFINKTAVLSTNFVLFSLKTCADILKRYICAVFNQFFN